MTRWMVVQDSSGHHRALLEGTLVKETEWEVSRGHSYLEAAKEADEHNTVHEVMES